MKHEAYAALKQIDALHRIGLRAPALTGPLRLASYAGYRALELALGRRHPHEGVVAQARELERGFQAARPTGKKVLFFTVRGWYAHATPEALIAKALQLRGAEVVFFLCQGQVPQCDFKPATDAHVTRPLCWRCRGYGRRLLDALELPYRGLSQLVDRAAVDRAAAAVSGLSRQELEHFTYRDLPLYTLALPSIQRSLLRGDPGAGWLAEKVTREYVQSAMVFADACEALLERERPDRIVETNGLFVAEGIMLELGRRKGIPVITYERGMVGGSILLNHDTPAAHFDVDAAWEGARSVPLRAEQDAELESYLQARSRGKASQALWPRMESSHAVLIERLGLRPEKPMASMFTNVLWDTAVFRRDVGFEGMFDWVLKTIAWFERRPELQLLIRVHPAEIRITMFESRDRVIDRLQAAYPRLPANVTVVPPDDSADSYELAALSDAVLVYTSTMGLEMALRGRAVVVAGKPHYRGRGFTSDLGGAEDLDRLIPDAMSRRTIGAEQLDLARRYAYMFFFRYMHPFPWVVNEPRSDRRLVLSSLQELRPGGNRHLDAICDGILDLKPFVLPESGG